MSLNIMQQEPLLPSFWKRSKSFFGSDVKYCRRCGQGTTKNERDTCKVCGLSSWISRADKDKLHPRWLVIGSVIPPPNSWRATPQRSAPRDPTIAKNIRSNYLFINFYPHLSWFLSPPLRRVPEIQIRFTVNKSTFRVTQNFEFTWYCSG
jgi:hypothetical protein